MQSNPRLDIQGAERYILNRLRKELAPELTYHSIHHTEDVLRAATTIAETENISAEEMALLRVAVLFHDSGYLFTYDGHEEKGCELVRQTLPGFGFADQQIDLICQLVLATQIPHIPQNKLERIICDADLDYLGRDEVAVIAEKLYQELKSLSKIQNKKQWIDIQIQFLESHQYHTSFSIQNREKKKQQYLENLKLTVKNH